MSAVKQINNEISDAADMKLWSYLKEMIIRNPSQFMQEGEIRISYQELLDRAERLGQSLPHKKYGILCSSMINSAVAILACLSQGITAVPMSRQYGKCFEEDIIEQIEISAVLTDDNGELHEKIIVNTKEKYEEQVFAFILCTSGSTGKPKGVCLSEEAVLSNIIDTFNCFVIDNCDRVLAIRGLFHCTSIIGELLTCLCLGANIYFYTGEFLPNTIYNLLLKYKITAFFSAPTILYYLALIKKKVKQDLSVRFVSVGGEKMNINIRNLILETFPETLIIHSYGLTETCSRAIYCQLNKNMLSNCVGKPLPSLCMIVMDYNGIHVKNGEIGELCVKGKNLFCGYYQNDKKT